MKIQIGEWQIRSFTPDDVPALIKYANNRNISMNLRDRFPYPYTESDANNWIQYTSTQDPETSFCIASSEELIGGIGFELQDDIYRRSAEMGYWIGEPHWGKGIATEAVRGLTEYAFTNFDLVRIFAGVFDFNSASIRVLEKAGFSYEGRLRKSVTKNGKMFDLLMYAIIR